MYLQLSFVIYHFMFPLCFSMEKEIGGIKSFDRMKLKFSAEKTKVLTAEKQVNRVG